jgi:hypothetical protein
MREGNGEPITSEAFKDCSSLTKVFVPFGIDLLDKFSIEGGHCPEILERRTIKITSQEVKNYKRVFAQKVHNHLGPRYMSEIPCTGNLKDCWPIEESHTFSTLNNSQLLMKRVYIRSLNLLHFQNFSLSF